MSKELVVNGKHYPMWSQFVEKKAEWIGGRMFDVDNIMGQSPETEITDVELIPNGTDSAMICFKGKDYDCSSDVQFCGIGASDREGWLRIATRFGNDFYFKKH